MSTIGTSTSANANAFPNQRHIDRCQNGVLWSIRAAVDSNSSTPLALAYSADSGTTWTAAGTLSNPSATTIGSGPDASLFIDLDDYAHIAFRDSGGGGVYYTRGTPGALRTSYSWSTPTALSTPGVNADLVAHRDPALPGAWVAHVVSSKFTPGNSNSSVYYSKLTISSASVVSLTGPVQVSVTNTSASAAPYASIDFNHTGDAKTVAGSTPHLYVGWSAGTSGAAGAGYGLRFKKATYAAGSWTWGTEREIDNTLYIDPNSGVQCMFDGTRILFAGAAFTASQWVLIAHERDVADTTTLKRTLTAAQNLLATSCTYDSVGDLFFIGRDAGSSNATSYSKWTRSSATLSGSTIVDFAAASSSNWVSVRRSSTGGRIDFMEQSGTSSPYTVSFGSLLLNNIITSLKGVAFVQGGLGAAEEESLVASFQDFTIASMTGSLTNDPAGGKLLGTFSQAVTGYPGWYRNSLAFEAPKDILDLFGNTVIPAPAYLSVGASANSFSGSAFTSMSFTGVQLETREQGHAADPASPFVAPGQLGVTVFPDRLNFATNPNFSTGVTTGWEISSGAATLSVDSGKPWWGTYALAVDLPAGGLAGDVVSALLPLDGLEPGGVYTASVRVYTAADVQVTLRSVVDLVPGTYGPQGPGDSSWSSNVVDVGPLGADADYRLLTSQFTVPLDSDGSAGIAVVITRGAGATGAVDVHVAGVLVEAGRAIGGYFDGDFPSSDYAWESGTTPGLGRSFQYTNFLSSNVLLNKALASSVPATQNAPTVSYGVLPEFPPIVPPVSYPAWMSDRKVPRATPPANLAGHWTIAFSDEFSGNSLDSTKWLGNRYGGTSKDSPFNKDIENAYFDPANVLVANGNVSFKVQEAPLTQDGFDFAYSSGVISTNGLYSFGRNTYVEARVYIPKGSGLWPAFWCETPGYGWPPETDIFEFFDTSSQSRPQFNYHPVGGGQSGPSVYGDPAQDYRNSWHTYGMHRDNTGVITPYIDGVPYSSQQVTGTDSSAWYLMLDMSIYRGTVPPTDEASRMRVSWVRTWTTP